MVIVKENVTMKNLRVGAWIITLVALFTIVAPFVADWNATHIYNPRWTPHAKFHNAQTMLLGVGLGLSALWFVWRLRCKDYFKTRNVVECFPYAAI